MPSSSLLPPFFPPPTPYPFREPGNPKLHGLCPVRVAVASGAGRVEAVGCAMGPPGGVVERMMWNGSDEVVRIRSWVRTVVRMAMQR